MRRIFAALMFILATTAWIEASTSARSNTRLAPGDIWCPTGLTFEEGRAGLQPSDAGVFDRGDLETSFRAPANGWVYVTLVSTSDIAIDNIMAVPRNLLFPPGTGYFESEACYRAGDPTYPKVRVHQFNTASPPPGVWLQAFNGVDLTLLKKQGWTFGESSIDVGSSAVEFLDLDDQIGVTADCPASVGDCPNGTDSLFVPAGTRIRFPMQLTAGDDYVLQLWWKAPEGAWIDVRIDDFSPCPAAPPGIFVEHESRIEVEILDATLKAGIDPEIFLLLALVEDQSDTFGRVTIDGTSYDVPQIDGDDHPTWDGSARYAKTELTDPSAVPVKIEMWDNDEFANAHVDLDMSPSDRDLDLVVDLCRMTVEGDLSTDMQGVITARGDSSSGDDEGLLHFRISTPSGRPESTDDLAVVDVDFVQAVHRSRYAVTEKPGVVMVSLANNFAIPISTEVLIEIYGPGGFWQTHTIPVNLDPDSLSTFYFLNDTPVYPPSPTPGVESYLGINVHVDPTGVYTAGLPSGDCRLDNDLVSEKFWKLVETSSLNLTWAKVGRVLDLSNLVSDAKLHDIQDLGTTFIRAVFPTSSVTSTDWPLPMPVTPTSGALDFIFTVFDSFSIPLSSAEPFALVWDMNTFAALSGVDKFIGVLPYAGWYEELAGWEHVIGNSLGEAAPHAVIVLPEVRDDTGDTHVKATLPGHELAHTFGVSADPRLKDTASCGVTVFGDPFGIGDLICGATGGLDEYHATDPARVRGNPATGFWVELGTEDPRLAPFADAPQCDRHCFMGQSGSRQVDDWMANGRWIDVEDWEHLIRRLKTHPDPEVIFIGGMIDPADNVHLGPWFRMPARIPDRVDGDPGGYRVRFYDADGQLLQDVGFPLTFGGSDTEEIPPITFFGFTVPWIEDTVRIDIDRGAYGQTIPESNIATRFVSENPPTVEIVDPPPGQSVPSDGTIELTWDAIDLDGDDLSTVVMASPDGDSWGVVHGWLVDGETNASIPASLFAEGPVQFKIVVTDGVHMAESDPVEIAVVGIFADGFESGDISAWTLTAP